MEGTPFGRYRLIELLGRGGMGEVWRAYDGETQRVVAVKVLPANLANDPTFEQRFRREALAAAGLTDPHVVPIHNFGEIEGRLYVDMRLISGRDLQAIIADGVLDPQRAVAIVEQIASALREAHRIGLVHRDVKPSNILVTENDFAYLIDFGIARAAGESTITGTGNVVGTWAYMAPERLSEGRTDPRGDTYSLACVLHECLTGSQPFPGKSIEQQIGGHLGMAPPRPSAMRSGLPPQLDNVIATGMAKNPDQRYASVVEMAAAARAALTAAIPVQRPPEPPQPATQLAPARVRSQNYYQPPVHGGPSSTAATQYRPFVGRPSPPPPPPEPGNYRPNKPGFIAPQPKKHRGRIIAVTGVLAVLAVIGIVAAIVLSGEDGGGAANKTPSGTTSASLPNSGPFTGTYTAAFGSKLDLVGKDMQGAQPAGSETWNMRSQCARTACTATASRSAGTFAHPADLVFDQVGDRWVAVALGTARCKNRDAEEWNYVWLKQRPDGSLVGEWISDAIDCYSKRTLTFTRNGDAKVSALPDPATLAPRVASPALALHGLYHSKFSYTSRPVKAAEENFSVDTICLRAGDRCLSRFLLTDGTARYQLFIFANGAWTRNAEYDTPCPAGGTSHVKLSGVFPLPNPPQDPIAQLSGHGFKDDSGSTCAGGPYDQVFNRSGD